MASSRDFGPNPLAIVGMGCLFPKADGLGQLWWNIANGVDAITEIPPTHWRPEDYFDPDPKKPDFTYARRGGFLDPVDFDPLAFGISPNNLEATDTAQILGLVVADAALRDAGYGGDRDFDRSRVSVVLGVTGTLELVIPLGARLGHPLWRKALKDAGVPEDVAADVMARIADGYVPWQENSFPGLLGNVVAGRIANRLNLGGTNCVVDAACASSLSAMHLAGLELESDRSEMVVTGGVDTFNDIFMYMCFSKTPALSPSGNSKPFANDGDGTILGEGIGMVVLKRLADAEKAGDKIYAVIRGIGSSSDGRGNAIYAPSAEGQQRALRAAYEQAGVEPASIALIEAHGTGTKVGDATEAAALAEVYGKAAEPFCAIGSIKSQIGHTKAAAGVAGIIKAALALDKQVLPPTIKVNEPLPVFREDQSPLYLNVEKRPWIAEPSRPRRAAVSAFGFGGSNFHCVLEEYDAENTAVDWPRDVCLFAFSAGTEPALMETIRNQKRALASQGAYELRRAAALSRQAFRPSDEYRMLIVYETAKGSLEKLFVAAEQLVGTAGEQHFVSSPEGIYFGRGKSAGRLAFLFPGQGSQYPGMLRDLACHFPEMRRVLAEADRAYVEGESTAARRLSDFIYPKGVYSADDRKRADEALRATQVAQPAIGAVSLGALNILRDFGIQPDAVAGHSYGELSALCAAGRFGADALLSLSKLRGQLMASGSGDRGGMLAVQAPLGTIERITREASIDLVIANKNAPSQSVLSGRSAELDRAAEVFGKNKIRSVRLPVSAAFHSELVAEASKPFRAALERIELAPASIPVFANTTAEAYPEDPSAARALLAGQLASPVEFVDEIEHLYRDGIRTFVEVGPGGKLSGLVRATLGHREHAVLAIDQSEGKRSGTVDLARVLAALAASGHGVTLTAWDPHPEVDVPTVLKRPGAHTVPICGANYTKPKQPRPAAPPLTTASAVEKPAAATKSQAAKPVRPVTTPPAKAAAALPTLSLTSQRPSSEKRPATLSQDHSAHDARALSALPPAGIQDVIRLTQQNLIAIQQMQTQTADVHRRFLEGQEAAQRNLFALIESQQQLLGIASVQPVNVTPVASVPAPRVQPVEERPRSSPPSAASAPAAARTEPARPAPQPVVAAAAHFQADVLAVIAEKTGYPAEMLTPEMELDGDLGIDSIKRVEIFAAFQEKFPNAPAVQSDQLGSLRRLSDVLDFLGAAGATTSTGHMTSQVIAAPTAANVAARVGETEIFAVIAEKTGYPAEMLHLDMELDGDLGIDSIKRVEIFAAFQEKFPGAPAVQSDQLGSLRTLRSVVDFLGAAQSTGAASAAPPAMGVSVGASDILAVIAEKTGYPAEMLHLDMELDGDLGIDSIKRVEIFAAFQEKFPDAPSVQSDQLGTLRRLSDVVAFFDASVAAASPQTAAAKAPTNVASQNGSTKGDDSLQRLIVRAVPRPSQDVSQPILIAEGAELWITDDGSDLAAAIASRLEALAYVPRIVAAEDADSLEPPSGLRGVIVLAPERADDRTFLADAFRLTRRALPQLKRSDRSVFVTVSRCDGMFGFGDTPIRRPLSGGLAGLAKTVGHECPMLTAKAMDISDAFEDAGEIAVRIVQEMFLSNPPASGTLATAACGAAEIGLTPEQTWTLELVSSPVPADGESCSPLNAGDVLVVTGGARGVTAEVAVELARSCQPTVVLLGRSALADEPAWLANLHGEAEIKRAIVANAESKLTPKEVGVECARILANREVQQNLARLRDAGSKVFYQSADVRNREDVARVLRQVIAELGPVRGIVHGAGVLADRKIEDKTDEQFEMVLATKVSGLQALLTAVDPEQLKLLVLFSSSTARFGRTGQVDYAIANECLNKLGQAFAKDHPACRVVSVNWGPWAGGMVTDSLARLFQEEGLGLIGLKTGAEYLRNELAQTSELPVEVVILGGTTVPVTSPGVNGSSVSKVPDATPLPVAFERVVDIAGHAFLDSHRLAGHPVVPMAVMVEWLAHGALHGNPGFAFHGFDDLRVQKGIILRGENPVTIRVHAGKAAKSGSLYSVPVEVHSTDEHGKEIVHAVAKIVLADRLPTAEAELELAAESATRLSPVTIYDEILFHGNHFQGIGTCDLYADGIVIQSETTPPPGEWLKNPLRTSWLADPLAFDTSFQAMIVWCYRQRGGRSLPSFAGRYRQFKRSFPRDGVRTVIKVTKSTPNLATASIEFLDSKGELIARMDQYECVIDPALEKAFQHPKLV